MRDCSFFDEDQINLSVKLKDAFNGIVFIRNTSNAEEIQK